MDDERKRKIAEARKETEEETAINAMTYNSLKGHSLYNLRRAREERHQILQGKDLTDWIELWNNQKKICTQ